MHCYYSNWHVLSIHLVNIPKYVCARKTSKVPRKHTNSTLSLPFLALRFPRISGFHCQEDLLAQWGKRLGTALICREKTGDFCQTDTHLHLNRRNLWGSPCRLAPCTFHIHIPRFPHHMTRAPPSQSAFLASFHPVVFTVCLSSLQVIVPPFSVTPV